jgi:hypothetical protein
MAGVQSHVFQLRKADGALERQRSRFANLLLPYEDGCLQAGLAHSWARMGIPMTAYGETGSCAQFSRWTQPTGLGQLKTWFPGEGVVARAKTVLRILTMGGSPVLVSEPPSSSRGGLQPIRPACEARPAPRSLNLMLEARHGGTELLNRQALEPADDYGAGLATLDIADPEPHPNDPCIQR